MAYRLVLANNCGMDQLIAQAKANLTWKKEGSDESNQFQTQGSRNGSGSSPNGSKPPSQSTVSDSSVIGIDDVGSSTPVLTNVFVTIDNPTVNGSQNGNVTESITVCGTIPTISAADSGSNANVSAYSQLRIWARMINHAKLHIA